MKIWVRAHCATFRFLERLAKCSFKFCYEFLPNYVACCEIPLAAGRPAFLDEMIGERPATMLEIKWKLFRGRPGLIQDTNHPAVAEDGERVTELEHDIRVRRRARLRVRKRRIPNEDVGCADLRQNRVRDVRRAADALRIAVHRNDYAVAFSNVLGSAL